MPGLLTLVAAEKLTSAENVGVAVDRLQEIQPYDQSPRDVFNRLLDVEAHLIVARRQIEDQKKNPDQRQG